MSKRPEWQTDEHDSTWERIKAAFANDWEQTKTDFGVDVVRDDVARDMEQDVDNTLKQAVGADDAFENREQAFRFGHAAQQKFLAEHPVWNNKLEKRLRDDYDGDYDTDQRHIRHAYERNYGGNGLPVRPPKPSSLTRLQRSLKRKRSRWLLKIQNQTGTVLCKLQNLNKSRDKTG